MKYRKLTYWQQVTGTIGYQIWGTKPRSEMIEKKRQIEEKSLV